MSAALWSGSPRRRSVLAPACVLLALGACRSAYYSTLEKFGVAKRDLLVERVEEGKEAQDEAKQQFVTTLERFRELAGTDPDELEDVYDELADEYESCESDAEAVHERIAAIEQVSADLFEEWEAEIEEIGSRDLRAKSEQSLESSRLKTKDLLAVMKRAESRMDPVLASFRDHVLYLKHNLNARAIASLEDTVLEIEGEVERLVAEMQASIDKADAYIASMQD
jgi:hypothetical protein